MPKKNIIAAILQNARGKTGGNPGYIWINEQKYRIAWFLSADLTKKQTYTDDPSIGLVEAEKALVDQFSAGQINYKMLIDAYEVVETEALRTWNYLRPYLKYYNGPDEILINYARSSSLEVDFKSFQKYHNQPLSVIIQEAKKNYKEQSAWRLLHGLYNSITYKIANEIKMIAIWNVLLQWYNDENSKVNTGNSIPIEDQTYNFNLLFNSRKETGYILATSELESGYKFYLPEDVKTELKKLIDHNVTFNQLKTALNASLSALSNNDEVEKTSTKNLAIGLGAAGGVLVLAGVGGFAYWFLKIRKS